MLKRLLFIASVVWASPYTCFGLLVGLIGCLTGGKMQRKGLAIEFYGGAVNAFLRNFCGHWVSAITFGNTILGKKSGIARPLSRARMGARPPVPTVGPIFRPSLRVKLDFGLAAGQTSLP